MGKTPRVLDVSSGETCMLVGGGCANGAASSRTLITREITNTRVFVSDGIDIGDKENSFFSFFIYLFGYLWHVGFSSPTRDGTVPPALEAWNLNHWTTGKSQSLLFNALKSLRI